MEKMDYGYIMFCLRVNLITYLSILIISPSLPNFIFILSLKNKGEKPLKIMAYKLSNSSWAWGPPCSVGVVPSVIPLRELDFSLVEAVNQTAFHLEITLCSHAGVLSALSLFMSWVCCHNWVHMFIYPVVYEKCCVSEVLEDYLPIIYLNCQILFIFTYLLSE